MIVRCRVVHPSPPPSRDGDLMFLGHYQFKCFVFSFHLFFVEIKKTQESIYIWNLDNIQQEEPTADDKKHLPRHTDQHLTNTHQHTPPTHTHNHLAFIELKSTFQVTVNFQFKFSIKNLNGFSELDGQHENFQERQFKLVFRSGCCWASSLWWRSLLQVVLSHPPSVGGAAFPPPLSGCAAWPPPFFWWCCLPPPPVVGGAACLRVLMVVLPLTLCNLI